MDRSRPGTRKYDQEIDYKQCQCRNTTLRIRNLYPARILVDRLSASLEFVKVCPGRVRGDSHGSGYKEDA